MSGPEGTPPERSTSLAGFLQEHKEEILAEWTEAARELLPAAQLLSQPRLMDFMPQLLDRIAGIARRTAGDHVPELPKSTAEQHALDRLDEGYDLDEVVMEFSLLRDCILRIWEHRAFTEPCTDLRVLNQAIDRAIILSVDRYTRMRNRVLHALDRISTVALEATSLDALLHELIAVFRDETAAVDVAAILLHEDDELRVRAAIGLGTEANVGRTLHIDDDAAMLLAEHRLYDEQSELTAPLLQSDIFPAHELRALHGMPLIGSNHEVVGIAYMGSRTAPEFSEQDRRLLAILASRATAGINQHLLREEAERRARELMESEKALRRSEERLRLAVEATELGAWDWNLVTGELTWSARCKAIFGLSSEETVDYQTFLSMLPPEDREEHDAVVRRALNATSGGGFTRDHRIVRADNGAVRWMATRARVFFDDQGRPLRVLGTSKDITEQRHLQERLRFLADASTMLASTLEYPAILERVTQLVVPGIADCCTVDIVRSDGTLGDFVAVAHRDPARVERLWEMRRRYPPRLDSGVGISKVLQTGQAEIATDVDEAYLRRIARSAEHFEALRSSGLESMAILPLTVGGHTFGVLVLANSGSGRRFTSESAMFLEELARRAAAAIDNARLHQEVRQEVQLRDRVLAIVSHDLRTPLGVIDMSSALLLKNSQIRADRQARKQLEAIHRAAERMEFLIGDLLDMSSIQTGSLGLALQPCELTPMLVEAAEIHEPLARERDIAVRTELLVNGHYALCDPARVQQVLSNLVGNAIKFCASGDQITLRAAVEGNEARISVADTGPGIAPEDIPHIFDIYWKAKRAAPGGTGLGLFISKGIVEAHGGRIWVDSQPGVGSTFTFTLPLTVRAPAPASAPE